jgi:hypothetical protein
MKENPKYADIDPKLQNKALDRMLPEIDENIVGKKLLKIEGSIHSNFSISQQFD